MSELSVLVVFTAGLFSFLSPCVLPLIPSYLSFVSGVSLEEMRSGTMQGDIRRQVVLNSLFFILGFSIVFISLGASAIYLGSLFVSYRTFIRTLGGILISLVGLYLIGVFKVPFLERYLQFNLKGKPTGYFGSVLVGITFALAWTPCIGPILGAVLTLAGTSAEVDRGMLLLATYAAGLGLPFFLSALAMNSFFQFSQSFRRYIRAVHVTAGILLLVVGVLILTDYLTILNAYAISLTPEWLFDRL